MTASIQKRFFRYVIPNIFGMMSISAYFLADTYFISKGVGPDGLTALNLVLPIYSLILGVGNMIAIGSATRFRILRAVGDEEANQYFGNALFFAILCSLPFVIVGAVFPEALVRLLGAEGSVITPSIDYSQVFLWFTPFFMCNHICAAFVRNDGAPTVAMIATITSSIFNIVMDYILMFPLGLGMTGAALATAFAPIIAITINLSHLLSKRSTVHLRHVRPSVRRFIHACRLGVAALVGDLALGITTLVFNFLILGLVGNIGVAAYGIIANIAYVAGAIFNGLSQGAQPLFSQYYGEGHWHALAKVQRLAFITGFVLALAITALTNFFAEPIAAIFNSTGNVEMGILAIQGIKLYFPGYLFAAFNITATCYLAATTAANWATLTSLLRGAIITIPCAFLLSTLFGMTGVWSTFAAAEAITLLIVSMVIRRCNNRYRKMMGAA